jgi:hypothetical protein
VTWTVRWGGRLVWRGELTPEDLGRLMLTFVCVVDTGYREIALVN